MNDDKSPLQLSRKAGDRILIALFSPVIMLFSGGFAQLFLRKPSDSINGLLTNIVAFELFFSVFWLSFLGFLWGVFAPRWIENALHSAARKVALLLVIPALGLVIALIYVLVFSRP